MIRCICVMLTFILINCLAVADDLNPSSCTGLHDYPQKEIGALYSINKVKFKKVLAKAVEANNNIGSARMNFKSGEKVVYRSSLLNKNPVCLNALTKDKGVTTIFNLYNGDFIDQETVTFNEENAFTKDGGQAYTKFLNFNDEYKNKKDLKHLQSQVADIIKLISATQGNVLIHCYGGMHRTGIVFGVLQKCVQKLPLDQVISNYKHHVEWKSDKDQGVYRPINVSFIKEYNCEMLN